MADSEKDFCICDGCLSRYGLKRSNPGLQIWGCYCNYCFAEKRRRAQPVVELFKPKRYKKKYGRKPLDGQRELFDDDERLGNDSEDEN